MVAAVWMSNDDECTLSMMADDETPRRTLAHAPAHRLAQLVDDGH